MLQALGDPKQQRALLSAISIIGIPWIDSEQIRDPKFLALSCERANSHSGIRNSQCLKNAECGLGEK
jgi:hypothetical protein